MTKKLLVQFYWGYGSMGDLEGLFITTEDELESWYGREAYFGEVLGKHSEIDGTLDEGDFTIKSDDQEFIDKIEELLGEHLSGFYPGNYISDTGDAPEEEESEEE